MKLFLNQAEQFLQMQNSSSKSTILKSNESRNFAITDTGMNDMIRPALYEAYMNIIEIDRTLEREKPFMMLWGLFAKRQIS